MSSSAVHIGLLFTGLVVLHAGTGCWKSGGTGEDPPSAPQRANKASEDNSQTSEEGEERPAGETMALPDGEHSWGRVATFGPEEAVEAFGEPDDCKPQAELNLRKPGMRPALFNEPPYCEYSEPAGPEGASYVVRAILFSEGVPSAIRLEPEDDLRMGDDLEEAFEIPEFDERLRFERESIANERRVQVAYRQREIDDAGSGPTLIGMDVFSEVDATDRVSHAVVYLVGKWPQIVDIVALEGPFGITENVVLPAGMRRSAQVREEYIELGVDRARLGPPPRFPRDPTAGASRRTVDPVQFPADAIDGPNDEARKKLAGVFEQFQSRKGPRPKGRSPVPSFFVGVDRTVPAERLFALWHALRDHSVPSLELVGRRVEEWDEPLGESGAEVLRSGIELRPRDRGNAKSMITVEVLHDGFDLTGRGVPRHPRDACPGNSPEETTLCLTRDVDVVANMERVRELRREGETTEADDLFRETLAAYDWARLVDRLPKPSSQQFPGRRGVRLEIRTEPQLPVGLAVRAGSLVQTRRCTEGMREQLKEVGAETDWCESGRRVPRWIPDVRLVSWK